MTDFFDDYDKVNKKLESDKSKDDEVETNIDLLDSINSLTLAIEELKANIINLKNEEDGNNDD